MLGKYILLAALYCGAAACSKHPTSEERALIANLEAKVSLPEGGGRLQCYERHYALLENQQQINDYVGVPMDFKGRKLLIGHYLVSKEPGVYWVEDANKLPGSDIADAGCSVLSVISIVGEQEPIAASCSPTFAGVAPDSVEPPVSC